VEGAILFKRNHTYYVSYGSCCCWCRGGSGAVFFSAPSILGPWTRLGNDKNCLDNELICGTYGDRTCSNLLVPAQGIGLSLIPTKTGIAYIWHGERWLSAAYNPPACPDECQGQTPICIPSPKYVKGEGFSYWFPLEFNNVTGDVQQFSPFLSEFTLDLL